MSDKRHLDDIQSVNAQIQRHENLLLEAHHYFLNFAASSEPRVALPAL
jgi:hypothetical protein